MNLELHKILIKYEKEIESRQSVFTFHISDLDICEAYLEDYAPYIQLDLTDTSLYSPHFGTKSETFYGPLEFAKEEITNKTKNLPNKNFYFIRKHFGKYKKIYIYGYLIDHNHINPDTNSNMKCYQYIHEFDNTYEIGTAQCLIENNLHRQLLMDIWHPNKKLYTKEEMNSKINSFKEFTL